MNRGRDNSSLGNATQSGIRHALADYFSSEQGYLKKSPTYCSMKYLLCLKEMMDDADVAAKSDFVDNKLQRHGLVPHQSATDRANGVVALFEPQIKDINQVSQAYRKRVERKIHSEDLSRLDPLLDTLPRTAAMRLKTVLAFADGFPANHLRQRTERKIKQNVESICRDAMETGDLSDDTLKAVFFGAGQYSRPSYMAKALGNNLSLQKTLSRTLAAYEQRIAELAKEAAVPATTQKVTQEQADVSLWKRMKEAVGVSVAGIGRNVRQGIAVIALGMAGVSLLGIMQGMDHDAPVSVAASEVEAPLTSHSHGAPEVSVPVEPDALATPRGVSVQVDPGPALAVSSLSQNPSMAYTVQEGDTLWAMVGKHLEDMSGEPTSNHAIHRFMQVYDLLDRDMIHPGERIELAIDKDFYLTNHADPGVDR